MGRVVVMEKGDLVIAYVYFVGKSTGKRRPFVYFYEDEKYIYGLRITTKIEEHTNEKIIIIDDEDLEKYKLKKSSAIRYDYVCRADKKDMQEQKVRLDRELLALIDIFIGNN